MAKTENINIRVPEELKEQLKTLAEERGVSMSEMLTGILANLDMVMKATPADQDWQRTISIIGAHEHLRGVLFWFDINKRCMEQFGGQLPPEARQLWADFMRSLGGMLADAFSDSLNSVKQQFLN